MNRRELSHRFWEDRHGNLVVWQRPNILLWIWFIVLVLNFWLPVGGLRNFLGLLSLISLVAWSLIELLFGINYFRRLLGLLVLLMIIVTRL